MIGASSTVVRAATPCRPFDGRACAGDRANTAPRGHPQARRAGSRAVRRGEPCAARRLRRDPAPRTTAGRGAALEARRHPRRVPPHGWAVPAGPGVGGRPARGAPVTDRRLHRAGAARSSRLAARTGPRAGSDGGQRPPACGPRRPSDPSMARCRRRIPDRTAVDDRGPLDHRRRSLGHEAAGGARSRAGCRAATAGDRRPAGPLRSAARLAPQLGRDPGRRCRGQRWSRLVGGGGGGATRPRCGAPASSPADRRRHARRTASRGSRGRPARRQRAGRRGRRRASPRRRRPARRCGEGRRRHRSGQRRATTACRRRPPRPRARECPVRGDPPRCRAAPGCEKQLRR